MADKGDQHVSLDAVEILDGVANSENCRQKIAEAVNGGFCGLNHDSTPFAGKPFDGYSKRMELF
jgi:hypothetical protein